MAEGEAIYVEGVGHIGQYYSYIDCLWEKGVPYFIRDYYFNEIQMRLEAGSRPKDVRSLVAKLNALNSDIVAYEKSIGLDEWHRRHQTSQSTTTDSETTPPSPSPSPARTPKGQPLPCGQTM